MSKVRHTSSASSTDQPKCKGRVLLVGSGPGDPDLLTVAALQALQTADVVLYDTLVAAPILDLIAEHAKRIHVGKKGYGDNRPQGEINTLMVDLAQSGHRVVRLKSGDPLIFGRAGEEIEACREAEIPLQVIPGITAAQGAAARMSVSLTHRHEARRLQYITGHDASGKLPTSIDWSVIADPQATTVVYMPRVTISALVEKTSAAGMDPTTPAIVIVNATRDNERQYKTTMAHLAEAVAAAETTDPMLVLIGQAMNRVDIQDVTGLDVKLA
ncbi:MAG: uroporphyrinogen-III C-methyltransferase [Hyphomicrobiaceae bacterium]